MEREPQREELRLQPVAITIPKVTPNEDIEAYLASFERNAEANCWPADIWRINLQPLLGGKAQSAYVSVLAGELHTTNYQQIKDAMLRRYNIMEKHQRLKFRSSMKIQSETYFDVTLRLQDLPCKCLHPEDRTREDIVDTVVT